jgi:Type I restriction-modification system methyltransferase subunit
MDAADIRNDDPISRPVVDKQDKLQKFDVVITNPPFALNEWGAKDFKHDRFNRFRRGIPPRSSGDYAFITHAVETMHPKTGRACVVAPLGVLFRGASEGLIRRRLIEENLLEGVIRLPANVLFGTSIPITLLLFKANKRDKSVLFIDASGDFVDEKNRSRLREQDIDKIVSTWQSRTDVAKYARLATFDEIQKNDFNLNLPLYVKAADDESYIDLAEAAARVNRLEEALKEVRSKLTLALGGLRR